MRTHGSLLAAVLLLGSIGSAQGTVVFHDDFESHSISDQITSQIPPVGEWGSTVTVTPTAHTVQANPLGAGQALRGVRLGTGGSTGFPTARTLTAPEPETIVTISWDTYRPDAGSGASVQALYMGTSFVVDTTINPNQSTQFIRYNPGTGLVTTAVKTGFGGWERWEMVIIWSAESGGKIFPTFDLFFERLDANNSEGILAKTQLADDVPTYTTGFDPGVGNMRWLYGINAHFNNTVENPVDSIVFFDNIQISVVPIPEPASLGLLGAGGLALLGVGRRRRGA